jgi:hypothetical protein
MSLRPEAYHCRWEENNPKVYEAGKPAMLGGHTALPTLPQHYCAQSVLSQHVPLLISFHWSHEFLQPLHEFLSRNAITVLR